jgi:hypothetical protein
MDETGAIAGENRRSQRETRHSSALSTTNPSSFTLEFNLGPCGEKQATNSLEYGITFFILHRYKMSDFLTSVFMFQITIFNHLSISLL